MTVGTMFGHAAWDYDRARRQLVPGFDRFYGAVLESIPFGEQQEIRVLDLGAGRVSSARWWQGSLRGRG
ncbi:MAG TPA: hypothetical protein VFQ10_13945 [Rubrobacter sp.]|nr:hypothetical protein [Rubrobacter sp.]